MLDQLYKKCTQCNRHKSMCYYKKGSSMCKHCSNRLYSRSPRGLIYKMYARQVTNSIGRGHTPPAYTKQWLYNYITTHTRWHRLYNDYVNSNYITNKIPSIDRIDSSKPYTIDNIQLVTWLQNKQNNYNDMKRTHL